MVCSNCGIAADLEGLQAAQHSADSVSGAWAEFIVKRRALLADYVGNAIEARAFAEVGKAMANARDVDAAARARLIFLRLDCRGGLSMQADVGMESPCDAKQGRSVVRRMIRGNGVDRLKEAARLLDILRDRIDTGVASAEEARLRALDCRAAAREAIRDGGVRSARKAFGILQELEEVLEGKDSKPISLKNSVGEMRPILGDSSAKADEARAAASAKTKVPNAPGKQGSQKRLRKQKASKPSNPPVKSSGVSVSQSRRRMRRRPWRYFSDPIDGFQAALSDGKLLLLYVPLDDGDALDRVAGLVQQDGRLCELFRAHVVESRVGDARDRRVTVRRLRRICVTLQVHWYGAGRGGIEVVDQYFFGGRRVGCWLLVGLSSGQAWAGVVHGKADVGVRQELAETLSSICGVAATARAAEKTCFPSVPADPHPSAIDWTSHPAPSANIQSPASEPLEIVTMADIEAIEALVASKSYGRGLDGLLELKRRRGAMLTRLPADWQARVRRIEDNVEFLAKRRAKVRPASPAEARRWVWNLICWVAAVVFVFQRCAG